MFSKKKKTKKRVINLEYGQKLLDQENKPQKKYESEGNDLSTDPLSISAPTVAKK